MNEKTYHIKTNTCKNEDTKNLLSLMSSMVSVMSDINHRAGANYESRNDGETNIRQLQASVYDMQLANGEFTLGDEDEWWAGMGVDKKKQREEKQGKIEELTQNLDKLKGKV